MVDRFFLDLFGVAPTTSQRTTAVSALTAGSQTPGDVIAGLRNSDDHRTFVDPVTRLYRAVLLRIPDEGGLRFWIGRRRSGSWTLNRIAQSFVASNEFKRRYGTTSNLAFVTLVYSNVLERTPDPGGLDYWVRQLDLKRKSRGQVMANFSESSEYKRKQSAEVNISVLHTFLLDRAPGRSEFDAAVTQVDDGQSIADLATSIITGNEYARRIAELLIASGDTVPTLNAGIPISVPLSATSSRARRTITVDGTSVAVVELVPLRIAAPPVIVIHGWPANDDADTVLNFAADGLINGLLASGHPLYLVFTGSTWNTDAPVPAVAEAGANRAIDAGLAAAELSGHDTSRVYLFASSHGGAVALRWAWEHPERLAAAYLYAPFVSFEGTYRSILADTLGVRASMHAATGTEDLEDLLAATTAIDPIRNTEALEPIGGRLALFAITADEVVPYADIADLAAATGATVTTSPGSHFFTASTTYDQLDPVRWFASHP